MSDYRFGLIVMSDSRSSDKRKDKVKPVVEGIISRINGILVFYDVVPDEMSIIKETMLRAVGSVDVLLTSGGTGLYPRDVTPQVTRDIIEYEVPGITQAVLINALGKTKRAMLTRMVAGVRGDTLIINLPGSPRAVEEDLKFVVDVLPHAVDKLKGDATPCGG